MDNLTAEQIDRNTDSRDNWDAGAAHRRRVMNLITQREDSKQARLCVLGAGNCNDLDLSELARLFAEVHLIDLDESALQAAVVRQCVENESSIKLHPEIDVTGIWNELSQWSPQQPVEDAQIDQAIEKANRFVELDRSQANLPTPLDMPPFDLVVSTCLISQLIEGAINSLGQQHPRFLDMLLAVRDGHLRLMTQLTAPGGCGLLVTDVVSAVTAPQLRTIDEQQVPDAVAGLIKAGNFFHGLHPLALMKQFHTDPVVAPKVEEVELIRPWRWKLGPRVFAVMAIKYRHVTSPN